MTGEGATQREADEFAARVTGNLLKSGHVGIVNREHLRDVMEEQRFSHSQFADPSTAAALGRIVGASDILYVELSMDDSSTSGPFVSAHHLDASASFTLVAVTTAAVTKSGVAQGAGERDVTTGASTSDSPLSLQGEAISACADDLLTQLI